MPGFKILTIMSLNSLEPVKATQELSDISSSSEEEFEDKKEHKGFFKGAFGSKKKVPKCWFFLFHLCYVALVSS